MTNVLAILATRAETFPGQQWAKAGIHRQYGAWIPAFAGMTIRFFEVDRQQAASGFSGIES